MAIIKFKFEDASIPDVTAENVVKGYSILEVTEDYDVHLNHNCGGVCACSTCHIYIKRGENFVEEISDKEEDFIDRAINPKIESRRQTGPYLRASPRTRRQHQGCAHRAADESEHP